MKRKDKKSVVMTLEESRRLLDHERIYAVLEAYKLLRTNLTFSIPGNQCKVIGVTSAMQGEGKTTTAINMAYTIARAEQKVLLLEADLRLPNISRLMQLERKPGLSNLLVGQTNLEGTVQNSKMADTLSVIVGGDTPPNPAELLGSVRMEELMKVLASQYDTIIVDLPPVTMFTDALTISRLVSGYVMVVRQNVCDRSALEESVRQMEFVDARILGFVVTGADHQKKNYQQYWGGCHGRPGRSSGAANGAGRAGRKR